MIAVSTDRQGASLASRPPASRVDQGLRKPSHCRKTKLAAEEGIVALDLHMLTGQKTRGYGCMHRAVKHHLGVEEAIQRNLSKRTHDAGTTANKV